MLLKTIYQWDLDSKEDLKRFEEESLEIHRQAERTIYRRGANVLPGEMVERTMMDGSDDPPTEKTFHGREDTRIFSAGREEFLDQLNQDLDRGFLFEDDECYQAYSEIYQRLIRDFNETTGRHIPRQIVVRATVEHRGGKPVRAEFLEIRGDRTADLPNPNAGGIRDTHLDENGEWSFVVEAADGTYRLDQEMHRRAENMYRWGRDFHPYDEIIAQPLLDTLDRLARREMDDREDILAEFLRGLIMNET